MYPVKDIAKIIMALLADPIITVIRRITLGKISFIKRKFFPAELAMIMFPFV